MRCTDLGFVQRFAAYSLSAYRSLACFSCEHRALEQRPAEAMLIATRGYVRLGPHTNRDDQVIIS